MAARIRSLQNGINPVDEASRDDLVVGDVVTVSSLDAATTYAWAIVFAPDGSAATFSGDPTAISPGTFTVDLEGPYLIRLIVDAGLGTEDTQYVRLRYLTEFGQLHLVSAGERRDGTGIIPVDVDPEGWANEQNANLQTLLGYIKPFVNSGRVFHVDGGSTQSGDYTTIQAAIDAAVAAGASSATPWAVLVHPGTYTENVTFAPWVHVYGWPASPLSVNNRVVSVVGTATAAMVLVGDEVVVQGLRFLTSASTASATVEKTGLGYLYLQDCSLEVTGLNAAQGPCLLVTAGRCDSDHTLFWHTSFGNNTRNAVVTNGASTLTTLRRCSLYGPNGLSANPSLALFVYTTLIDCEILSTAAAGFGVYGQGASTVLEHCLVTTANAVSVSINPAAGVFVGPVGLTVRHSYLSGNLRYDTTNLAGLTTLDLGSVIYGSLVYPAAAPTQTALTQAQTLYHDNAVDGLTATTVQTAIEELAARNSLEEFQEDVPVFGGQTINWFLQGTWAGNKVLVGLYIRAKGGAPVSAAGTYLLTGQKNPGAANVLGAANYDLETLVNDTLTAIPLTGTTADRTLTLGQEIQLTFTSNNVDLVGDSLVVMAQFQ